LKGLLKRVCTTLPSFQALGHFSEVGYGKANQNHNRNGFFADPAGPEFEKRMVSEMSR
jgi:hypothetical protein